MSPSSTAYIRIEYWLNTLAFYTNNQAVNEDFLRPLRFELARLDAKIEDIHQYGEREARRGFRLGYAFRSRTNIGRREISS